MLCDGRDGFGVARAYLLSAIVVVGLPDLAQEPLSGHVCLCRAFNHLPPLFVLGSSMTPTGRLILENAGHGIFQNSTPPSP